MVSSGPSAASDPRGAQEPCGACRGQPGQEITAIWPDLHESPLFQKPASAGNLLLPHGRLGAALTAAPESHFVWLSTRHDGTGWRRAKPFLPTGTRPNVSARPGARSSGRCEALETTATLELRSAASRMYGVPCRGRSRLQLAPELVEEAPVGALGEATERARRLGPERLVALEFDDQERPVQTIPGRPRPSPSLAVAALPQSRRAALAGRPLTHLNEVPAGWRRGTVLSGAEDLMTAHVLAGLG